MNTAIVLTAGFTWSGILAPTLALGGLGLLFGVLLAVANRIACYQKALALYQGDYLSESTMEDWVLPWANYYKRIYSSCVNDLVKLLMDDGEYASAARGNQAR